MKLKYLITASLLIGVLNACKKEDEYPVEPVIAFRDFVKFKDTNGADSLQLTVSFTDGDGDIGNLENDQNPQSKLYSRYFEKINGVFTEINLGFPPSGIPYVPVSGRNKNISGDISVSLFANPLKVNDTVRYEVYITDRAGHKSNAVTSSELITNQQ